MHIKIYKVVTNNGPPKEGGKDELKAGGASISITPTPQDKPAGNGCC